MKASVDKLVDDQFAPDFIAQSVIFAPFSTQVGDRMEKVDGVATVSRQQMLDARVNGEKDSDTIGAADADYDDVAKLEALRGSVDFGAGKAVVNQDKAKEEGWKVGDTLTLAFPAGKKLKVEIGGISKENVTIFGINIPLDLVDRPANVDVASLGVEAVVVRVEGRESVLRRLHETDFRAEVSLKRAQPGRFVARIDTDNVSAPPGVRVVRVTPSEVRAVLEARR